MMSRRELLDVSPTGVETDGSRTSTPNRNPGPTDEVFQAFSSERDHRSAALPEIETDSTRRGSPAIPPGRSLRRPRLMGAGSIPPTTTRPDRSFGPRTGGGGLCSPLSAFHWRS